MTKKLSAIVIICVLSCCITCVAAAGEVEIKGSFGRLIVDDERGTWTALDSQNSIVLKDVFARAVCSEDSVVTTAGRPVSDVRSARIHDNLGSGTQHVLLFGKADASQPTIEVVIATYDGRGFVTVESVLRNTTAQPVEVKSLTPAAISAQEDGGLYLGCDPTECVILENGYATIFDPFIRLLAGYEKSSSNTSSILYSPSTGRSFMSGFLWTRVGITHVTTEYERTLTLPQSGVNGFTRWEAICEYLPPKTVEPGCWLRSEKLYVDFSAASPFVALENYAKSASAAAGTVKWSGPVPNGWNSWGAYRKDINEQIILDNLEFMARKLKPVGFDYFQIDAGWQQADGDWDAHPERFPRGMKWMAEQIRLQGLKPGIWLAPFQASASSRLATEHPDWFLPKTGLVAQQMDENLLLLDLTLPEVKTWLRNLFHKVAHEWGYEWVKIDFAYYAIFAEGMSDRSVTGLEAYRNAMNIVRDAVGEDVFFLGVAAVGANYDIAHGVRITYDVMPRWEDKRGPMSQGVKDTARNVARRYFIHGNIWINHPDLLYFTEPLTPDEQRCWATVVGLSGGVVKLGDKLVEMSDEAIDNLRKMLPIYGRAARPVDLFAHENPEVWDLKVDDGGKGHILGIFHWGENVGGGIKPRTEEPRAIVVDLTELGEPKEQAFLAYEFWEGKFLGIQQGSMRVQMEPRTVKVIALRPYAEIPSFISVDSHITQGATDIRGVSWDGFRKVLRGKLSTRAGQRYVLTFYVPAGFYLGPVTAADKPVETEREGNLLRITVDGDGSLIEWRLAFE